MKRILVTGGLGYIGAHTVVELLAAGHTPVIVDNLANSKASVLDRIEELTDKRPAFYKRDFQDAAFMKDLIVKEQIDGVIHFAAFKAVGESVENPLKYYNNNVAGLISLLSVLSGSKVRDFVFSSSCTVYGNAEKLPVTEATPIQQAESPYGATKQMGEQILRDVSHASQLRGLALRYFNPIGAHPSAAIGELPIGAPTILVPVITQAVAGWRDNVTVFGNDYPTPDGTCVRDYIHVVDLAKAHVKALEYTDKQKTASYDVCNIGTGKGSSVLEVIQTFEQVTGKKVPYTIGKRRPGDVVTSYANVDKARKLLDWQAEKSLADGLTDAWRWQQTLKRPN